MGRVKFLKLALVVLSSLALILTGCGGGGGSGTGGGGGGGTDSGRQASQEASSGIQARDMAMGIGDFMMGMGSLGNLVGSSVPQFQFGKAFKPNPGMEKAAQLTKRLSSSKTLQKVGKAIKKARTMNGQLPISGSVNCTDGGTITYSGTYDDQTGSFNLDLFLNNCREDGTEMNGPVKMSGQMSQSGMSMNFTYGDQQTAFTIEVFENNSLVSKMTMKGTELSMNLSQSGNNVTMSSTMNGTVELRIKQQDYIITYNNFKGDIQAQCLDQYCSDFGSVSLTANGKANVSWTEGGSQHSVSLNYSNFKLSITFTTTYEDASVSGKVSIDFTPDECPGGEGTFVFATITPVRYDIQQDKTTQGHITINSNTHIVWNSDDTITVWYDANGNGSMDSGEVVQDHVSWDELEEICEFATFGEES